MSEAFPPPPSVLAVALLCRYPRCGKGALYNGLLSVAPACASCSLDLGAHDAGDGPAVFVVFALGAIVVALGAIVEVKFAPPVWLHLVLWTPFVLIGSVVMLRFFKAGLIALQYRHRALSRHSPP